MVIALSVILIITTSLAVYAVVSAYELGVNLERVAFSLPRAVKAHLAILGATIALLLAANHIIDDKLGQLWITQGEAHGKERASDGSHSHPFIRPKIAGDTPDDFAG